MSRVMEHTSWERLERDSVQSTKKVFHDNHTGHYSMHFENTLCFHCAFNKLIKFSWAIQVASYMAHAVAITQIDHKLDSKCIWHKPVLSIIPKHAVWCISATVDIIFPYHWLRKKKYYSLPAKFAPVVNIRCDCYILWVMKYDILVTAPTQNAWQCVGSKIRDYCANSPVPLFFPVI